jgi:predicted nucleic acid-binding protein
VRFWDTSAVVLLLVEHQTSPRVEAWVREDEAIALWTLTPVEVVSALRRLVRENSLAERDAQVAERRMDELVQASQVVIDVEPVKALATRLLRLHALRAFDALQLGAALHWAEGHPQGRILHTLDGRLALAAQREGFTVPP